MVVIWLGCCITICHLTCTLTVASSGGYHSELGIMDARGELGADFCLRIPPKPATRQPQKSLHKMGCLDLSLYTVKHHSLDQASHHKTARQPIFRTTPTSSLRCRLHHPPSPSASHRRREAVRPQCQLCRYEVLAYEHLIQIPLAQ